MNQALNREPDVAQARSAAARLVREYALTCPGQIVLEDIAWDRGVCVKSGQIEGAEGWLLRNGNKGLIRVSDRIPEVGRQRFTIGHELGHWELHMNVSQTWVCSSADIHAYRGSTAEIEANVFASELLMPREMLQERLAVGSVSFDLFRQLALEFNTTLTATALRVVEEANEDSYVILSHAGKVKWWKRNERRSHMYLDRGQTIHPDSLAWRCEYDQIDHCGMTQVPTEAWFRSARHSDEIEVWEESVLSREYETVLTLLCVV